MKFPAKDIKSPNVDFRDEEGGLTYRISELESRVNYAWGPDNSITAKLANPRYREAPLYLTPGTWDISSGFETFNDGEQVVGSGYYSAMTSNGASPMWTVTNDRTMIRGIRFTDGGYSVSRIISGSDADNIIIESCSFGFSSASGIAISLTNCDNVSIRNCSFAFGTAGIYLLDCDNAMITGNRIRGISRSAGNHAINLDSTGTGSASTRCNDCIVSGNHVSSVGSIRYNTSGAHLVGDSTVSGQAKLNNISATLTAY